MFDCAFCKSCEPICEPEIVLKIQTQQWGAGNVYQQIHVHCSGHKLFKKRKETILCIGNFKEKMDLSRIYLAVQHGFAVLGLLGN